MAMEAIRCENLSKHFGKVVALDDLRSMMDTHVGCKWFDMGNVGLQDTADGGVAAVQLAFQPTISTESGPQNG